MELVQTAHVACLHGDEFAEVGVLIEDFVECSVDMQGLGDGEPEIHQPAASGRQMGAQHHAQAHHGGDRQGNGQVAAGARQAGRHHQEDGHDILCLAGDGAETD